VKLSLAEVRLAPGPGHAQDRQRPKEVELRDDERGLEVLGRVAEVVEIAEGGVGSEGLAKEEPTPWTKLRQPRRPRH
jgi:hypothetical protein